MIDRQKLSLVLLTGAVAITRFAFRSNYLYDLDSVNFALALERFDPHVHQPQPPGYFLYVCLGRLLNTVFHDANMALVTLSILASCALVVLIYKITLEWFGLAAAEFAGILFLFSPLAWFHGIVALTYIVEAFFSGLLGVLCWRIYCGRAGFVLPAAVVLGISAGVRPSSLLFLTPLFVFSLRNATPKGRWLGLSTLALTLTAWFVPMVSASGGLNAYFDALASLWLMVPSKETVINSSPVTSLARACTIIFIYFLTFGPASLVPLAAMARAVPTETRKRNFTFAWIAPALCFFTFGYLKFVNSGYLLMLCPPACIWLGFWASEAYKTTTWQRSLKLTAIAACIAANLVIFVAAPLYCSYGQVRRFEGELKAAKDTLPRFVSPNNTLIVSFDSHFVGFRHAGYYLPDYVTLEYPEAHLKEGLRVFSMHDRDTHLLTELPSSPYTKFILFPLPDDPSYRRYMQGVVAHLPSATLHTVSTGGSEFVIGPISDLPLLFPHTTPALDSGVYVPLHHGLPPVNSRSQ